MFIYIAATKHTSKLLKLLTVQWKILVLQLFLKSTILTEESKLANVGLEQQLRCIFTAYTRQVFALETAVTFANYLLLSVSYEKDRS